MKKLALIALLASITVMAKSQDTLHFKNSAKEDLKVTVNWATGKITEMNIKADSTNTEVSYSADLGAGLIIRSTKGMFGSNIQPGAKRGNYTIVISWNTNLKAYRTYFRPYKQGD